GGGAIPLEAMRLGCEATAADINPVAWFILKCTLEYPQKLAGKTHPLPDFILEDDEFMTSFYKAHPHLAGRTKRTKAQADKPGLFDAPETGRAPRADLAWHVRAWGCWVLARARRELAPYYPTYADFEPLQTAGPRPYERQPMRLVPLREDGTADIGALNRDFGAEYLADPRNPRWVAKPAVAYLWARTATCRNCRATMPLLKTRWLAKKENKRVLLTMEPNAEKTGVIFGIEKNAPARGGNAAQKREHDRRLGAGTMSRAGAKCPCCDAIMTMDDLRAEGKAGRLGALATAVIVDVQGGKDYRLPTDEETASSAIPSGTIDRIYSQVPYGVPEEPTPAGGGSGAGRAFSVQKYGLMRWRDLFTPRQLAAAGVIARDIRLISNEASLPADWTGAIHAMLLLAFDRFINYTSTICIWEPNAGEIKQTFLRFALPITWDFAEANPLAPIDRYFAGAVSNVARVLDGLKPNSFSAPSCRVENRSAIVPLARQFDAIITD